MSMITDHIAEFLETVIAESPSREAAQESIETAFRLTFPGPETKTVPVTDLQGGEVLVSANGNRTVVDGEAGPSSSLPGLHRVETEHGVLYLDPDSKVMIETR